MQSFHKSICIHKQTYLRVCNHIYFLLTIVTRKDLKEHFSQAKSSLFLAGDCLAQPIQTLVQTISGGSTASLDVPLPASHVVKMKLVRKFGNRHGVGEILFVGEHKKDSIAQFILPQHFSQLLRGTAVATINSFPVVGVHHKDDGICVLVVVAPQRTNFILTPDVPVLEKKLKKSVTSHFQH